MNKTTSNILNILITLLCSAFTCYACALIVFLVLYPADDLIHATTIFIAASVAVPIVFGSVIWPIFKYKKVRAALYIYSGFVLIATCFYMFLVIKGYYMLDH